MGFYHKLVKIPFSVEDFMISQKSKMYVNVYAMALFQGKKLLKITHFCEVQFLIYTIEKKISKSQSLSSHE